MADSNLMVDIEESSASENSSVTFSNNNQLGIISTNIEDEMRRSYLDYAMSVIISRALPDCRDGLKPVQRRILYTQYDSGNYHNKPYLKSARIVGSVMGKYHPHGDGPIYSAMARMTQPFLQGIPLVDGQGNFGSIDGDEPAQMRYTEVRLAAITERGMLEDIDKQTVDFNDNYDGSEKEPTVLPVRFPNLLINGSNGIAVGMATSIPPYNMGEILDACCAYINDENLTPINLLQYIPAPDFPTGGEIINYERTKNAMLTGRGGYCNQGQGCYRIYRQ